MKMVEKKDQIKKNNVKPISKLDNFTQRWKT